MKIISGDFSTAKLFEQAVSRWPSCQRKLISSKRGAEQCTRRFVLGLIVSRRVAPEGNTPSY